MPNGSQTKRKRAVILLAAGTSHKDTAQEINVHPKTIYRWLLEPDFAKQVLDRANENLKHNLPEIYNVLSSKALQGSHQHLKILMDHLKSLEEIKAGMQSAQISFTWNKKEEEKS